LNRSVPAPADTAAEDAPPSRALAYALLPLVVLLWGANWPAVKVGLAYVPPLWFATLRTALGAACLFAFLALTGKLARPTRRDLPIVVSVALLQIAIFQPLTNFGLRHVAAGRAAVLVYTTPLWVTPGAVLLLGERLTRLKVAGLACGFGGVGMLFNPLALDWSSSDVVLGSLQLTAASMVWGLAILHIRAHRWHLSPLQLTPWQLLLGLGLLLPLTLVFEGRLGAEWNPTSIGVIVYNGPIATAFCYWAATTISRALPAITTSLSFLGVPAVGILCSLLFLGERPDAALLGGFGLILVGVTLVNLADR
jgi:drug/metabolite transporter (DMT)-like permease